MVKAFIPGVWPRLSKPTTPSSQGLEPDLQPLYGAWRAEPNPTTTGALLRAVQPALDEAIRSYGGTGGASPTLLGKARSMALNAFQTYDPARGKLKTHLLSQLQGLRRVAARETQPIKVPEGLALDWHRVRHAENELRDQLDRDPSDAEIADRTGLSLRRLTRVRELRPSYAEGQQTKHDEEGEYTLTPSVQQQDSPGAWQMWQEYVYTGLDPIDQVILEHSAGLHGKPILSTHQIARKIRRSPGLVSQRRLRIQSLLDEAPLTRILGD